MVDISPLVSAAAEVLITAAATDAWQSARQRIQQLFETDKPDLADRLIRQLEESRARISAASAEQSGLRRHAEQAGLETLLLEELIRDPDLAARVDRLKVQVEQQMRGIPSQETAGRDIVKINQVGKGHVIQIGGVAIRVKLLAPLVVVAVTVIALIAATVHYVPQWLEKNPASALWGRWECDACTGPVQASAYEFYRDNTVRVDNNALNEGTMKYDVISDDQIRFTGRGILYLGSPILDYVVQGDRLTLKYGGESATYIRV